MAILQVSPTAQAICIALARYRFLTVSQMLALKIAGRDGLYKTLRTISERKRGLVERKRYGVTGYGQMPDVFFLTKYGAEAAERLGRLTEPVNYPARDYTSRTSVPHNTAVVDCHIMLDQWAAINESQLEFCHRDFDTGLAKGTRKTSVQTPSGTVVPDMVFQFKTDGKSRLCCLELYRDESSTRVVKSLTEKYTRANREAIGQHYGFDQTRGIRVLSVFTNPKVIPPTLQRLKSEIDEKSWPPFFFSSPDRLQDDFRAFWVGVDANTRKLF